MRVLLLVLPLITGGALAGAARGLGIRLPRGLQSMMGMRRGGMFGGGGYYGSRGYGMSSGGSLFGGGSGAGGIGSILKAVSAFA